MNLAQTSLGYIMSALVTLSFIGGCATLPENINRSESQALSNTGETKLGQMVSELTREHPDKSGSFLLTTGLDAFVARVALAHVAEQSIDVQYYLYHNDLVGHLFTDQLLKAADRGVRVRLLVDDMALANDDKSASALDEHPNMEVRIFNPFSRKVGRTSQFITRFGSVTRRMHNKSFTVDNQVTILGGRNIGNEYFEADPDLAFADLDVLTLGPVAQKVSSSFDRYWNSELSYPASSLVDEPPTSEEIAAARRKLTDFVEGHESSVYIQALKNSALAQRIRNHELEYDWGNAVVLYDQPEKILHSTTQTEYHMSPQLEPYLNGIDKELTIFSPYFVPGKVGTKYLTDLVKKGVRVRILTNSLASNDVGVVHAGYAKYRRPLLRGGVELYELNKKLTKFQRKEKKGSTGSSKASLHTKSFIFDREQVFIGSLNLDPRSVEQNTEIGVILDSPGIPIGMAEWFDENINKVAFKLKLNRDVEGDEAISWHGTVNGEEKTFWVDPYTGFWRRFGLGFVGLFPIESQL